MVAIMPGNQNSSAIKRADRGSVEAPPDLPTEKVQKQHVGNKRIVASTGVFEVPSGIPPAIRSDGRSNELDCNGYANSGPEKEGSERDKRPSIQASYHKDEYEFQEDPIVLHPDMIDEDTEDELDYQISELSQSTVLRESGQEENSSRPLSESNNDDALDVVKDPWAAVASLVDPDNPEDQAMTHKRSKSRKSKEESFVQRFHKSRLTSGRNRRSSTGSKSSNKSSWSASSQSSTSTGKKRGRPPKEKPPVLFCYRCTIPFQSFVEWREHAVYKHIAAKDPYPIVEMNYVDPSKLRSGITLEKYSDLFSEDNVASDEDVPMPTLRMFTEEPESSNTASASESTLQKISLPDLSTQSQDNFTSANAEILHVDSSKVENTLNTEESEYPKEQLKLRFSMNKKAGTYVVRQSSVESVKSPKSPLAVASNSSSSPVGNPDVSDYVDLSMDTCATNAFNNNVVIKNSNVSSLHDTLPELVGDNATNDSFISEVTTATPILEARLKLTNAERFLEDNLHTKSPQSVITRNTDSNKLDTLSKDERVPSESKDNISGKLNERKSRKRRKSRKVSEDVGICVEDMLNAATETEVEQAEKEQTQVAENRQTVGDQELNLLVNECAEEMIKMAECMQSKEEEDAQIREDVAKCVRDVVKKTKKAEREAKKDKQIFEDVVECVGDVVRKTKEAEREAKKDKQIFEDVLECVGDVVQQTVSIEAELDAMLDNDYEILLDKATELSRKGSSFHQNFVPAKTTGEQLQLIKPADCSSSEPQDMISKETLPGGHTTPLESPDVLKTKDRLMADSDMPQKDSEDIQDPATPPLILNDENSNDSDGLRIACDEDSAMERLDSEVPEIDQPQKVTNLEYEDGVNDKEEISEINHDQPALSRRSSTETISAYEENKNSISKDSNQDDNGHENNSTTDALADDDEEVDDFQCHLCKKVFESDEEVSQHFSNEHVRITSFEPESPYPATPAEPEDTEGDNRSCITEASHEKTSSEQRSRSEAVQESSSRSTSSDALTELLLQKTNTTNNVRTPEMSHLQHSFTIRGGAVLQTQNQLREGDYQTAQRMASSQPDVNRFHQQVQMALAAEMRAAPTSSVPGIMVGLQRQTNPTVTILNRPALNQANQQQQPPSMIGTGARLPPQLIQRPPQPSRQSPPSQPETYSNSLRNALTSGQTQQVYNNPNISIGRSPRMPQGNIAPRPQLRPTSVSASSGNPLYTQHHHPASRYPVEGQQGQGTRAVGISSIQERSRDPNRPVGTLAQTIAHEQHLLNEAREVQRQREAAQRLLLQQRIAAPAATQSAQMSRLQYSLSNPNQQSSVQQQRDSNERAQIITRIHGQPQLVTSGQKRSNSIEMMDVNDVRANKQSRLDNQNVLSSSAEITISHRIIPGTNTTISSPGLSNSPASQANQGSGANNNNNSVRIGNSITLSVCPGDEGRPGQSAIRSNQYSNNRPPAVGVTNPQNASVLAVRGVTVASHSPPNQSKSPVITNPTPSNSPVVPQNYSGVIQRGPGTASPQRNPSPPVNAPNRGVAGQIQHHNFAVPRAPATIRGPLSHHQAQQQASGNSAFSVNSTVDRPNRPPTVDLTEDDIQAHHLNQQMAIRLHGERQVAMEQHQRRLQQTAQAAQAQANNAALRAPRPALCNMCNSNFPSVQALDEHKVSYHGLVNPSHLRVANSSVPTAIRANPNSGIQIREVRSMNPSQVGNPVRAPPPTLQPSAAALLRSQNQARTTNSPTRPAQQQSTQRSATPPGKYFYIPLLDLSRVDESKMRKLEELGISCVVPLQGGNNMMSHMGIPVMNLRGENNLFSNHIPWDSVIPMGPVHQATTSSSNNAPTASTNIRSTERDGNYQQQTQQPMNRQQQYQHNSTQQQHPQSVNQHNTGSGAVNGNNRVIISRPAGYHQ